MRTHDLNKGDKNQSTKRKYMLLEEIKQLEESIEEMEETLEALEEDYEWDEIRKKRSLLREQLAKAYRELDKKKQEI